jgi:Flp pilus assembly protein CpaB
MTEAGLQRIQHQLAVYNSLFRREAEALLAEVYRLRAVLDEIRVLAHDDLCRPGTDSAFLPEIEALARAALAPSAAESNR